MARSFGNGLEDELDAGSSSHPYLRANFKTVLVTMARNFKAQMLRHEQQDSTAVSNILHNISTSPRQHSI